MVLNAAQLDAITQEARACFLYEDAPDYLAEFVQGWQDLQAGQTDAYNQLLRTAHSLKGGAGIAQLPHLSELAHSVEDVLTAMQQGRGTERGLSLLGEAIHQIEHLVSVTATGGAAAEANTAAQLSIFQDLTTFLEGLPAAEAPLPELVTEPSAFILKTALSVDLEDCLQRTEAALEGAEIEAGVAELRESCLLLGEALSQTWLVAAAESLALTAEPDTVRQFIRQLRQERDQCLGSGASSVPPPPPAVVDAVDTAKAETEPTAPELSLRLPLRRLDRLNDVVGELFSVQERLNLLQGQLRQTGRLMQQRTQQFNPLNDDIRLLYDRLAISAINKSSGEFDALEMDSYSELHTLLQAVQELMVRVQESRSDIELITTEAQQSLDDLRQHLDGLRSELVAARLVPFKTATTKFQSLLSNLSQQFQKPVQLDVRGAETAVDQAILEQLNVPFTHLLRNAFDHGIELPAERLAANKPATGTIRLAAIAKSNRVVITISDDGRGLNYAAIARKAVERGLATAAVIDQLNEAELTELLFTPGFSTAENITSLSGRGVGLDIVRLQVERLRGTITADSQPGQGTTWTLSFPLSLNIQPLLLCRSQQYLLALPAGEVAEIISLAEYSQREQQVVWQGQLVPVQPLAAVLGYAAVGDGPIAMVLRTESGLVAASIDQLLGERELTVKTLDSSIPVPPFVGGCTVLGSGEVVPVIAPEFLQRNRKRAQVPVAPLNVVSTPATTILIADDSIAVRRMLDRLLSQSGYRVIQCRDGKEAIATLHSQAQRIDLVITDIEMPGQDGFGVLQQVRYQSPSLPVFMLTSRAGAHHRDKAMGLGATAYFSKPFDAGQLLSQVAQHTKTAVAAPA